MRLTKKDIEKRNKRFRKASKGEKRRMIAQEVLDLLKARKISASVGIYLEADGLLKAYKKNPGAELRDVFPKLKNCQVCAIGGACLALANIEDKLKLNDLRPGDASYRGTVRFDGDDDVMRKKLGKYFSQDELRQMEAAFEINEEFRGSIADEKARDRLRLIMENIVKNKKFSPPKEWIATNDA